MNAPHQELSTLLKCLLLLLLLLQQLTIDGLISLFGPSFGPPSSMLVSVICTLMGQDVGYLHEVFHFGVVPHTFTGLGR